MKLTMNLEFIQEEIVDVAACCGRIQLDADQVMQIGKGFYIQSRDSIGCYQYHALLGGDTLYPDDIWNMADVNDELPIKVYRIEKVGQ